MGEAFIVKKTSGSSGASFATISVVYPSGSTCTCSKGAITLSDQSTNGKVIFIVPEAGTWTVTASNGDNTNSQNINITTEGQFIFIELSFALTLFDNLSGGDNTAITGGWSISGTGSDYSEITSDYLYIVNGGGENVGSWYGGTSTISTKNTINTSKYNTAEITIYNSDTGTFYVGSASRSISGSGTYTLDISNVNSGIIKVSVTRPVETWNGYAVVILRIKLY